MHAHVKSCQNCGQRFLTERSDTRWCTNSCKQKAYRQAQKHKALRLTIDEQELFDDILARYTDADKIRSFLVERLRAFPRGRWWTLLQFGYILLGIAALELEK